MKEKKKIEIECPNCSQKIMVTELMSQITMDGRITKTVWIPKHKRSIGKYCAFSLTDQTIKDERQAI